MASILNAEQKSYIARGFAHMVDNGYSRLETATDVLTVLETQIERAKRELLIGKQTGFDCHVQEALLESMQLTFNAIACRVLK